ncbi:hypothetical protein SAMN04515674_10762 [Pseudarcicella hirudinis]|uniref:Uncharacterized protein n=1 Tax=Pseudarcicella hirudinis TaxID=1079859 RepID=A0A1I5U9D8_9BACT|nr:DUF6580 family putative transport protein [Pseudarcicella hirudinis]SFP91851.1 hypothetical protein SAMN04515674_10762 [Pseudarcicella hirudinis]
MKNTITPRFSLLVLMIGLAALSRFLFLTPSMANFSPVGAMALFGGAYFVDKRWSYLVPIIALWLSNLVLNNVVYKAYYPTFSFGFEKWVFISFIALVSVGILMLKKVSLTNLLFANLAGTLVFFIVSNFGVWAGEKQLYPKTFEGLVTCYTMALPFLKNSLISNLLFSGVMFGAFELAKTKISSLQSARGN